MIYHKPYYHTKEVGNQTWLFDYQEQKPLALVLDQNSVEIKILYKASPEIAKKYSLPEDYNPTVIPLSYSINKGDMEEGFLYDWRLEYENHPGGSGRAYSLTRANQTTNWRLTYRDIHYEIPNTSEISDPKDLIKISSDYEPYIELVVQKEGWPENSDQYQRTDPLYKDILTSHDAVLWFPAWRVFGEEVNQVVPWSMVDVPGFGVSSFSGSIIPPEDFSYDIPTNTDNVQILFRKLDKKYFKANLKNNSLVLEGEEEFELTTSLTTTNGLVIQTEFYLPEIPDWDKPNKIKLLNTEILGTPFNLSLIPKYADQSYLDAYLETEYRQPCDTFALLLEYGENFSVYSKDFKVSDWYIFSFGFFSDRFAFEFNGLKVNENEGTLADSNIWKDFHKFDKSIFLFKDTKTIVKEIKVLTYGEELIHPLGHFVDYKMVDYYQLRSCRSDCPWAVPQYNNVLNQTLYIPKKSLDKSETQLQECPFQSRSFDPFRGSIAEQCSGTSLVPINVNYPQKFSLEEIQSPHYKIEFSINSEPFSPESIVDQQTCKLLYDTFEEWRPASRAVNYELAFELKTDFSGAAFSLFSNSSSNNWSLRSTLVNPTFEDCFIYNSGSSGFDAPKDFWLANHNLNTTKIVGQAYTTENKLVYANSQSALNDFNYFFDFSPNRYSGFSLLHKASSIKAFDLLTKRPFMITTGKGNATASVVQVLNSNNYRQEIEDFLGLPYYLRVEILELLETGDIVISDVDQMFYVSEPSKVWLIKHDTGILAHLIQVYNEKWQALKPSEVIFLDKNYLQLQFDAPVKGTVGLKHVGNPYWKQEVVENIAPKDEFDSTGNPIHTSGYFLIGDLNGSSAINWGYGSNFSNKEYDDEKILQSENTIKVEISAFYETEKEYIFTGVVPGFRYLDDLQVREIGLFDRFDNLCFYAQGTLIYIVREFDFKITFRISKEDYAIQLRNTSLECTCEDCEELQKDDCIKCSYRNKCTMRLDRLLKEVRKNV